MLILSYIRVAGASSAGEEMTKVGHCQSWDDAGADLTINVGGYRHPQCIEECRKNPVCNVVQWEDAGLETDGKCTLLKSCPTQGFSEDTRWNHIKMMPKDQTPSDYELWSPRALEFYHDGTAVENSQSCVLGRSVVYKRRKQDAKCHNERVDSKTVQANCGCTRQDYECASGFEVDDKGFCEVFYLFHSCIF